MVDENSDPSTSAVQVSLLPWRQCDPDDCRHGGFSVHKIALIPA